MVVALRHALDYLLVRAATTPSVIAELSLIGHRAPAGVSLAGNSITLLVKTPLHKYS